MTEERQVGQRFFRKVGRAGQMAIVRDSIGWVNTVLHFDASYGGQKEREEIEIDLIEVLMIKTDKHRPLDCASAAPEGTKHSRREHTMHQH